MSSKIGHQDSPYFFELEEKKIFVLVFHTNLYIKKVQWISLQNVFLKLKKNNKNPKMIELFFKL